MAKKPRFQSPTGMHDILPEDQKYFQKIYDVVKNIAHFYNFQKIETPILEETELFSKGIGLATDIVQKEMFSFRTKGGDYLTMRPEGTAPIVRAYIENGMQSLPKPVKLWHFGPFFRYERPQAGRYRQFWQFGLEVFGEKSPAVDAQIIQIFYNILGELKLKNLIVEVNSIGASCCRPYYKKILVSYLRSKIGSLCANCRRRLKENPLRILDCKEEKCQRIVSQGPQTIDHLCKSCRQHFKEVLEFLDELELPYHLNPYLVRGLDYYTKTVFEIFSTKKSEESLEISKNSLAGGGRYDVLIKILGGKDTPAMGAAAGIDRIIILMKEKAIRLPKEIKPQFFLAQLGNLAKGKSLKLMEDFRKARIPISEFLGRDSLRAQLKMADRIGARYTLILGQKEALEGTIIIRNMKTGRQKTVKTEKIVSRMKKLLKR
ncbi:MAG: histidine--tRNA ligase [Candidatus Paceibacterales bacterium]